MFVSDNIFDEQHYVCETEWEDILDINIGGSNSYWPVSGENTYDPFNVLPNPQPISNPLIGTDPLNLYLPFPQPDSSFSSTNSIIDDPTSIHSEESRILQQEEHSRRRTIMDNSPNELSSTDSEAISSDDEWTEPCESTEDIILAERRRYDWTNEECQRLRKAIAQYGEKDNWKVIAQQVGTRNISQCINKWKNDLSKKNKKRWNASATRLLLRYLQEGKTPKEIESLMQEYTYIQIYQQIQKLRSNSEPWEEWEIQLLIQYKREGNLTDTQIGHKLNNRHRDAVKNMWNRIRRNYHY